MENRMYGAFEEDDVMHYYGQHYESSFVGQEPSPIRACIVLPTYNEAKNVQRVLDLIYYYASLRGHDPIDLLVLVVDDNSPDGTAEIIAKYREKNNKVHLLLRNDKQGLGAAYVAGMQYALENLNPDIILEMDADLQHNPADVFRLIDALDDTTDMTIGSRYIEGGRIPQNWGLHRKLVSYAANLATKIILQPGDIKDCTGGFRAIKADVLRKIDLENLDTKGYAFQAILLQQILEQGASVKEIPISFGNRLVGESKMSVMDLAEGGIVLLKNRFRREINGLRGESPINAINERIE